MERATKKYESARNVANLWGEKNRVRLIFLIL